MILLYAIMNYISGNDSLSMSLKNIERIEKTKAFLKQKWEMIRIVTILYFRNLY
jgi:hypothetical protein